MIELVGQLVCENATECACVERHLEEHIRLTRAEPGCLLFEVIQSDHPLVWDVREKFASRAAFEQHQARVAGSEWGRATEGIAREYEVVEHG